MRMFAEKKTALTIPQAQPPTRTSSAIFSVVFLYKIIAHIRISFSKLISGFII